MCRRIEVKLIVQAPYMSTTTLCTLTVMGSYLQSQLQGWKSEMRNINQWGMCGGEVQSSPWQAWKRWDPPTWMSVEVPIFITDIRFKPFCVWNLGIVEISSGALCTCMIQSCCFLLMRSLSSFSDVCVSVFFFSMCVNLYIYIYIHIYVFFYLFMCCVM